MSSKEEQKTQVSPSTIPNNIQMFQQTFKLINLSDPKSIDLKQLKQKIGLYSEQYVAGNDRKQFHKQFIQHNTLQVLVNLLYETNDFEVYQSIMKALNIISYNLQQKQQIDDFLTHPSIHRLLDISNHKIQKYDSVQPYVQFLKSIVQRLKQHRQYIKLFFNEQDSLFTLLWKVFLFYNQPRQNSRTTTKLIILQIAKIHDPTIELYLNNFPSLEFVGLFSRHILYTVKKCLQQQNKQLFFEIADEINFMDEFSENAHPPTKNYILNSVIYYPIKYIWNCIQNKQTKIKDLMWLILIFFLNTTTDHVFSLFLCSLFFSKRIQKQLYDLLVLPSEQLQFYCFKGDSRQLQAAKQQIQQHCTTIFFPNKQQTTQTKSDTNTKSIKQTIFKEAIQSSKNLITNIFKREDKCSVIKQQLMILSKVVGTTVELITKVNNNYENNIYVTYQTSPLLKSHKIQNNTFFSSMMERLNQSSSSTGLYLSVINRILRNQMLLRAHQEVSFLFIDNLPSTLKLIENNKTVFSMFLILQNISISVSKLDQDILQSILKTIKPQLNEIAESAFQTLLQSDFTDWQNYIQIFFNQQTYLQTKMQQEMKKPIPDLNFQVEEEQLVHCEGQLVIHYASTLRNIIRMFTKNKYKSCKLIVQQYQNEATSKNILLCLSYNTSNTKIIVNGTQQCCTVINNNYLQLVQILDLNKVVIKQHLNRFYVQGGNSRKIIRQIGKNIAQYYISPTPLRLQFESEQDKICWIREIQKAAEQVNKRQIIMVMGIVEDIPCL